jgi:hypothetical protein
MPPKPTSGDNVTLTARDASALRAGLTTGSDGFKINPNKIGEALRLNKTRHGQVQAAYSLIVGINNTEK